MQIKNKFIGNNEVTDSKIRLTNNNSLRARNAANTADINIVKVNSSDKIDFNNQQLTNVADPTNAQDVATKQYVDDNSGNIVPIERVYIKDIKSSGTAGGTFTSGAWQTRDLNTVQNSQSWISVSSNQIILDPGTYSIRASAPAHGDVSGHKLRLRNITDSTNTLIGSSEQNSSTSMTNRTQLEGTFTITATKTFEIQHYGNTTKATDGFGTAVSISGIDEVYTSVEIERIISGGVNSPIVFLKDVKTSGTSGGGFTSGAWQTRTLNTTENGQYWISLSSNQITLDPGTYLIEASAPGYFVDVHQARLYNTTDSTETLVGSSELSDTVRASTTRSFVQGIVTIAASKTFELQHQCFTTNATNGFGAACSFTSEVYSIVKIQKLA